MALGQFLRPGEEEWLEVLQKLAERFPAFGPDRVAQVLRENDGHAGQAAGALRDMSGTAMRPVDPDDAEHVRTLLSSPAMFAHACKEQFRKFDVNSDGALEWVEILALVNALYDGLGLQPPREGGLKAFFEASDTNGDGVLSEKEFTRFFECFLRYAFFDVHNHEQGFEPPAREMRPSSSQSDLRQKEVRSSPQKESRRNRTPEEGQPQQPPQPLQQPSPQKEKKERESRRHKSSSEAAEAKYFQCVAPNGCSYRRSADYQDRSSRGVPKGEVVQALEAWIRTPNGWLPISLESGELLFRPADSAKAAEVSGPDASPKHRSEGERSSKRSSKREEDGEGRRRSHRDRSSAMMDTVMEPQYGSAGLLPHEEAEWGDVFKRLQGRFPTASPGEVAEALRLVDGHAGQAATKLRELAH